MPVVRRENLGNPAPQPGHGSGGTVGLLGDGSQSRRNDAGVGTTGWTTAPGGPLIDQTPDAFLLVGQPEPFNSRDADLVPCRLQFGDFGKFSLPQ